MRLVEFLTALLEAQSETLKRLAAFFGEDRLLEMLESSESSEVSDSPKNIIAFKAPHSPSSRSPYMELEGSVHEFGLPAVLEFHLWAYPYYRAFIESELDLNSIASADSSAHLLEEAIAQAKVWVAKLPIPPAVSLQAEAAASVPWIRFRTQILKRVGRRPMGAV